MIENMQTITNSTESHKTIPNYIHKRHKEEDGQQRHFGFPPHTQYPTHTCKVTQSIKHTTCKYTNQIITTANDRTKQREEKYTNNY